MAAVLVSEITKIFKKSHRLISKKRIIFDVTRAVFSNLRLCISVLRLISAMHAARHLIPLDLFIGRPHSWGENPGQYKEEIEVAGERIEDNREGHVDMLETERGSSSK
jgi:hypothetical protein